jgi:hypothetical protein
MSAEAIELNLDGEAVRVPRELVRELAAAAAERAGVSARHRDLSLLLHRALESERASLRPIEVRTLCAVLEEVDADRFGPAGAELLASAAARRR